MGDIFAKTRAIVVGYGSIGARHARLLDQLGCVTAIVSRRRILPDAPQGVPCFTELDAALSAFGADYVVLANETAHHLGALNRLAAVGFGGSVLVEKPLGIAGERAGPSLDASVFVGYNLRFHPLLAALHVQLAGRRVVNAAIHCGSYLPDWRPGRDYRTTESAKRESGGGVLHDLSHELDYLLWLFGGWRRVAALGGKLSCLEIDTEDSMTILADTERCPAVSIHLDYLRRPASRGIQVNCDDASFALDFIQGTLTDASGAVLLAASPERDSTYIAQHQAILSGAPGTCCTLSEGWAVMDMIEAVGLAAREGTWVRRNDFAPSAPVAAPRA